MPDRTLADATNAKEDYTGHERDAETGLHYAGARYYMSALGRWTSVDPLADAQHLLPYSPYHYSYNNPLSYTDPDGKNPILRGLKVVKRAYQAYKRGDNLASLKTWKKMGVDEVAGFVDNVRTLADGTATADDAFAVIDLVTGFGGEAKKGARALGVVEGAGDARRASDPDFVVMPDGTSLSKSQMRMRESFENAGFPKRRADWTSEKGVIHTVPTDYGDIDVRTMKGGAHHPRRVVTTRAGTNDPTKLSGERIKGNLSKQERRDLSHLEQEE
jgi:RHS repeat-associated protein